MSEQDPEHADTENAANAANTANTANTANDVDVLIIYAWDDDVHKDRCRTLAERLRGDGVAAWIDQFVTNPPQGWPRWMAQMIAAAKMVITVGSPLFRARFEGTEAPDRGRGATWEGLIVNQTIHDDGSRNETFVPALFEGSKVSDVLPTVLRPFTRYTLWRDYDVLLRHLTGQPEYVIPPIGPRRVMPPRRPASASPGTATPATPATPATSTMPAEATPAADTEPVLNARTREEALYELLRLLFDRSALTRFLAFMPEGREVIGALPGAVAGESELMFKTAEVLRQRGLVNAGFFSLLGEKIPSRTAVIEQVRGRWT